MESFRRQFRDVGKPVIVTDALSGWAALERWTPASLAERFPDRVVKFKYGGLEMPLREFIPQVLASSAEKPAPYLTNLPLAATFPELLPEISPLPDLCGANWAERGLLHPALRRDLKRGALLELYIGGPGGAFPIVHWDGLSTHVLLMQVHGIKQYWVWPPEDAPFLYATEPRNVSAISNVETPDLQRFPRLAKARTTTFTLHPGELLFVPSRWWHTARMLTPSITVSQNLLNHSNWANFTDDLTHQSRGLAGFAKRTYLKAEYARHRVLDLLRAG
ncbi:MAG: cupin-like domain-containing protein [Verrucomicrobiales bacterium]|nr:cupin-like domain-containing protein [Verrucomicrobiales bacterium]